MKLKKYIYGVTLGALSLSYTSCYNADKEFPDYEGGTTAYFAYQYPVRTLVLGNDIYDNSIDNEHKCRIWATMGGAYGGRDASVSFVVDESLCDNLYFVDEGGNAAAPVLPMPREYYTLSSNTIHYNGEPRGYVEVQFTDAFFNDPKAIEDGSINRLQVVTDAQIENILAESGVEDQANKTNKYSYALRESNSSNIKGDGHMDYVITGLYQGATISAYDNYLFVTKTEGKIVAHNTYNFGNFLWGAGMAALGIPYPIAKLGAHLNNFFFDTDSKWHLDSKDDQFSIKLGYQWRQER